MVTPPDSSLTIFLEPEAHRHASQFAAEQTSLLKGKQVYLNTLAVCAVNTYMHWLAIDTALHRSDCWHRGLRSVFDVADLILPTVGRLECRPVLPDANAMVVPTVATTSCLGYVAVGLDSDLQQASLLGFLPTHTVQSGLVAGTQAFTLNQLSSLDELLDTLYQAQQTVKLQLWFEQIFQQDWQPPNQLLPTAFRRRSPVAASPPESGRLHQPPISRGKVVTITPSAPAVILVLELLESTTEDICTIRLRVFPTEQSVRLPTGLQLQLLDAAGHSCGDTTAHSDTDWLEFVFGVTPGEQFCLQLILAGHSVTEAFEF